MDAAVQALASANGEIAATLQNLDDTVAKLRGEWTGAASDAYDRAHADWLAATAAMNQVLDHARSTTSEVSDRHRTAENAVKAIWG